MNKLKNILIVFILFAGIAAQAADQQLPSKEKHYRKLYFYTFGLQAYDYTAANECEAGLYKKYGFDYKEKAGCVVRPLQHARWEAHNNRVERKMVRRFGADWEKQYGNDLDGCRIAVKK